MFVIYDRARKHFELNINGSDKGTTIHLPISVALQLINYYLEQDLCGNLVEGSSELLYVLRSYSKTFEEYKESLTHDCGDEVGEQPLDAVNFEKELKKI